MRRIAYLASVVLAFLACRKPGEASRQPGDVIDSVLPMDVALDRFRKDLPRPDSLRGTGNRDTLVLRVIEALRTSDTTALERLAANRAEWAWLFYPTNVQAKPPYELPPGLAWFQLQEANRKGVFRALRELGGHRLDLRGYRCDPKPTVEGDNRLWTGCTVTLGRDGAAPVTMHLFGAILERDGRFAILSFANDF
jgi:hypothetical protein